MPITNARVSFARHNRGYWLTDWEVAGDFEPARLSRACRRSDIEMAGKGLQHQW